jgi:AraC-like DNA-binding protein
MQKAINEHYEVWGGDLEMPLIEDCGVNNWNRAERLSWHSHEGFELVLLLDGQAAFEFVDGSRCELSGGQFFFKVPRQLHRAADEVTSPCKMCWIVFDPSTPDAGFNTTFTRADLDFLAFRYEKDQRQVFNFSTATRPLLDSFWRLAVDLHSYHRQGNSPLRESHRGQGKSLSFTETQPLQAALLRSHLCQILLETARQALAGPPRKPDYFVAAAIAFMEENYRDDLDIDRIAGHLGLSRSYLHTVFRDGTGQTPNDYLQRTRIKAAEVLLGQTSNSVTEIAASVGFSSSQYFSKVFRKYTRQTPQEHRQSYSRRS